MIVLVINKKLAGRLKAAQAVMCRTFILLHPWGNQGSHVLKILVLFIFLLIFLILSYLIQLYDDDSSDISQK